MGCCASLFALIAALVLVLYALQRRDMKSVVELSQQLQRIAIGGRLAGRVEIGSDKPELAALATAVNHLLTRAAPGAEREAIRPRSCLPTSAIIHEAVLVHRSDPYANRQFASFVGVDRVELIGRRPGGSGATRTRRACQREHQPPPGGRAARPAERYEIDMVGLQAQVSRLEIASTLVEYDKGNAL